MSGLYRFFKGYLPDGARAAGVELEAQSESSSAASVASFDSDYSSKLFSSYDLTLKKIREKEEQDALEDMADTKDDDASQQENSNVGEDEVDLEFQILPMNYDEWRKEGNDEADYVMELRYDAKGVKALAWVESSANEESDDGDESEKLHSQPEQPPQKSKKNQGKIASKEAPTLRQAVQSITRMEDLDLYTQDLTFALCRVEKIWPLRDTERAASRPFSKHSRSCTLLLGRAARIPFDFNEEDGLVAPSYEKVLSLEVVQLSSSDASQQQRRIGACAPRVSCATSSLPKHAERRLKVFLYDQYAVSMQEWIDGLSSRQKQSPILMSFRDVPGACVVPFSPHHQNWLDKDTLLRHCLVIGGATSMKIKGYDGIVRFDKMPFDGETSTSLEIRATTATAAASPQVSTSELVMSPGNSEGRKSGGISSMVSSSLSLLQAYRNWEETEAIMEDEASHLTQSELRSAFRSSEGATNTRVANADRDKGEASVGTDKQGSGSVSDHDSSMHPTGSKKRALSRSSDGNGDIDQTANACNLARENSTIAIAGDGQNDPKNDNRTSTTRLPPLVTVERRAKRSRAEASATGEAVPRANTNKVLIYTKMVRNGCSLIFFEPLILNLFHLLLNPMPERSS